MRCCQWHDGGPRLICRVGTRELLRVLALPPLEPASRAPYTGPVDEEGMRAYAERKGVPYRPEKVLRWEQRSRRKRAAERRRS